MMIIGDIVRICIERTSKSLGMDTHLTLKTTFEIGFSASLTSLRASHGAFEFILKIMNELFENNPTLVRIGIGQLVEELSLLSNGLQDLPLVNRNPVRFRPALH